jgi:hypothetical protein
MQLEVGFVCGGNFSCVTRMSRPPMEAQWSEDAAQVMTALSSMSEMSTAGPSRCGRLHRRRPEFALARSLLRS